MSTSIRAARITLGRDLWRIAETGEVTQLHELLGRGAEIDSCNDTGTTALMIAAYHGRLEMVRALTDHGANVNLMDKDGFTAAMLAHRRGHDDVVRILVARGARKTPAPVLLDSIAGSFAQSQTLRTRPEAASTRSPAVRALPGSKNIWDAVPETQIDFDPRSALISHLPSINIVGLAVIALVLVGGSIFVFLHLKDMPVNPPAAAVQSEAVSAVPMPANVQNDTSSSLTEKSSPTATEPVNPDLATQEIAAQVVGGLSGSPVKSNPAVVTRPPEDSRAATTRKDQQSSIYESTDSFKKDDQTGSDKIREALPTSSKSAVDPPPITLESSGGSEAQKPEIKKPTPLLKAPPRTSPTPESP